MIHAAGADPMEERLRLTWDDNNRAVPEAVAEMSGWDGPRDQDLQVYIAENVGQIFDPRNFERQISGAVIWGLGHAISAEITHTDGMTDQMNYDGFEAMRLYQAPQIEVRGLELGEHVRGAGEPAVPPAAAALANAIFAATGQRLREMPFRNHMDFV